MSSYKRPPGLNPGPAEVWAVSPPTRERVVAQDERVQLGHEADLLWDDAAEPVAVEREVLHVRELPELGQRPEEGRSSVLPGEAS